MRECKFLAFADLHFWPDIFLGDADKRLAEIMQRAQKEEVSFVVQLGDFLHEPGKFGYLAKVFLDHPIPTYSVLGNHDTDQAGVEEILRLFQMPGRYYYFDRDGYRFVVLDPTFYLMDGVAVRHEPDSIKPELYRSRGYLPKDQLVWLEKTIEDSPCPCVLLSHQSLERSDGITNRDDAWEIICAANRRRADSVIMCINGHYHCDACNMVNDVCCLDLNSASYYWSELENDYYPQEYYEKYTLISHCLYYEAALSAVITLQGTDTITIQGRPGRFLYGLTEEQVRYFDHRRLSNTRVCTAQIKDYTVKRR